MATSVNKIFQWLMASEISSSIENLQSWVSAQVGWTKSR